MKHFGDPCIHCGTPHDDLEIGPCKGDPARVKIYAYSIIRQAHQQTSGRDNVRCYMSDGTIREEAHHPSTHWPYSERFSAARVRPVAQR